MHDASNMDSEHMHTGETQGANRGQSEMKRKLGSSLLFMWKNKQQLFYQILHLVINNTNDSQFTCHNRSNVSRCSSSTKAKC